MRHFLTLNDFSKDELLHMFDVILDLKYESQILGNKPYLKGKVLAMVFEKSSTRTRVSFESGIVALGGHGIFLSHKDIQLGRGEPIKDTARVISSMVDIIMMRTSSHSRLEEFAQYSSVPVINGLSDDFHPMQLMADYLTMIECGIYVPHEHRHYPHGGKKGKTPIVAYVGDGNNMAHSWINLAGKLGFELRIASPKGYEPRADVIESAQATTIISLSHSPKEAVSGANVVVTDTWASMGQEEQKSQRLQDFKGFCVDETMMSYAQKQAIFLHCLPAYRGQEVSDAVIEGEQSRVFQEAQNRLHAQKGVMLSLAHLNNFSFQKF